MKRQREGRYMATQSVININIRVLDAFEVVGVQESDEPQVKKELNCACHTQHRHKYL